MRAFILTFFLSAVEESYENSDFVSFHGLALGLRGKIAAISMLRQSCRASALGLV